MEESSIRNQIHEVIETIQGNNFVEFSGGAETEFESNVIRYVRELHDESVRLAHRQSADAVSAAHVRRADENLVAGNRRRILRHLAIVGGSLLGASLSTIFAMTVGNQFSTGGIIFAVSAGILGGFLIAFQIKED